MKEEAERILTVLGIPPPMQSICFTNKLFYRKVCLLRVKIPPANRIDLSMLTEEELHQELEKGYADKAAGRTRPAAKVFADLRNDDNL